jgi:hypothetical protein
MIGLGPEPEKAELHLAALKEMMHAIGRAQAAHLAIRRASFSAAESTSMSIASARSRPVLGLALESARRDRAPHQISWVLRRIHDLVSAPADVQLSTRPRVAALLLAYGATHPRYESYVLPGRGYFRLPGPVRVVGVIAAEVHPTTQANRTHLDIGRTLIHELVVHAWREVFLPGAGLPGAHPATSSIHQARPHIPSPTTGHNLADAEADLIDYYYDLARGDTLAFGERAHPGFARIVRILGGVMGSRIPSLEPYRRGSSEYVIEQAQFLERARAFRRQMDRMHQLESRVSP